VIDHGRVIADGTARELKRAVGSAHVELRLTDGAEECIATDGSVPDVRRILADVELRGVAVDSWEVRSPTLDDVFLTLTGRPTEPALVTVRES
jgi:ABC-2 type transport system ATP-binding protein